MTFAHLPLFLALLSPQESPSQPPATAASAAPEELTLLEGEVEIAVVYQNTPTGERHYAGIDRGVEGHSFKQVNVTPYPYINEDHGLELLLDIVRNGKADVVLGPTDSGIFVRAFSRQEELIDHRIPVVSGLVTAKEANERSSWFFRTNANVASRSHTIYDFVNKYWINSLAVIHSDNEFGRRAEHAFQARLSTAQRGRYLSLVYEDPPDPHPQIREILELRPEAVGLFVDREDMALIYRVIQEMNEDGVPYQPLLFSILDARSIADQIDGLHFVSVMPPAETEDGTPKPAIDERDDVEALGHDTALLVLNEVAKLHGKQLESDWRMLLRDQIAANLSRSGRLAGSDTDMSFTNFENSSRQRVLHLEDGVAVERPFDRTVGFTEKLWHKVQLVPNVYGFWPFFNVLLIFAVAAGLTWSDLRRWFEGSDMNVLGNRFFWGLTLSNFALAMLLYVYLCEGGDVRYDSVGKVLVIALTPSAFLRTTFFETPQGKSIGLEKLYRKLLRWVDEQIMKARHAHLQARVNVIAYNNSQNSMREILLDRYRNHPNPSEGARLLQELEEELAREPNYFNRRRIAARKLLHMLGWDHCRSEGLVPQSWDDHLDPQQIVRLAARYCARDPQKVEKVKEMRDYQLERIKEQNKERHDELVGFMKAELKYTLAVEGELNVNIRLLFVLLAFNVQRFIDEGLLDPEDIERERRRVHEMEAEAKRKRRFWRFGSKPKTTGPADEPLAVVKPQASPKGTTPPGTGASGKPGSDKAKAGSKAPA